MTISPFRRGNTIFAAVSTMSTFKYFRVLCQRLPKNPEQLNEKEAREERPFPGRLVVQDRFATVYTYKGRAMGTFEFPEALHNSEGGKGSEGKGKGEEGSSDGPIVGAEYVFRGGGREVRVRVAEELLLDSAAFVPFGRAVVRLVREDGFPGLKFTERVVGMPITFAPFDVIIFLVRHREEVCDSVTDLWQWMERNYGNEGLFVITHLNVIRTSGVEDLSDFRPQDSQWGVRFISRYLSPAEEYGRFFQLAALRPELALVPSTWVEKVCAYDLALSPSL